MEIVFTAILSLHIVAGSLSLVAFWIPAFTRKGGKAHVKSGKFYIWTMWVVVASAASLCILNLFRGNYISAGFLGFLTVLTSYPLWYGVVITNYKRNIPDRILNVRRVLNGLLFFGGIGLITWSLLLKLQGQTMLLLIFGTLGLTSFFATFEPKQKTRNNSNWLAEHLGGMIGSGIAAYTAFFAVGGRTIFSSILSDSIAFIPWVLPGIIGTISIFVLRKKWAPVKRKAVQSNQ